MFISMFIIIIIFIMFIIALLFHIHFKGAVRPNWKCRGCVIMIVMIIGGDAEDA